MNLVVVESPAKCKTITSYLGKGFKVMASFGHIRDLPSKQGSVDVLNNFAMEYQIASGSTKHVSALVKEAKGVDTLYLATDPDREGEGISWHVYEVLKQKKALPKNVKRITFNQITKTAVLSAVASPREVDYALVDAQQARLALDYLMGFNISPVLWRKLPGSRSAGRVQSVALRIVCEREKEIEAFKKEEYWTISATMEINGESIPSILEVFNGKKLEKFSITNEKQANEVAESLKHGVYSISSIERKETQRKPYAPFTTSTLQQEGASKLYFSPKKTMQVAQSLYEGVKINNETKGLITYMRTDSISISSDGVNNIRSFVEKNLGGKYLPQKPIFYASKQKNAQEAHEAVRPTDSSLTPEEARKFLTDDQFKLYNLIWRRSVACQMNNALFEATRVEILNKDGKNMFKVGGSVIKFDGFLKIYNFATSGDVILPKMNEGDGAKCVEIVPNQHFTQPPARFTEATLVKQLEEKGIGRPSTYASIISVIQERGYVKMNEQKRLEPELRGRVVNCFLERFFTKYVEYDFTANLEGSLDKIAEGSEKKLKFLEEFWKPFKENVDSAMKEDYEAVVKNLNEDLACVVFKKDENGNLQNNCPACKEGKLGLRLGKFGLFSSCSNYPECKYISNPDSGIEDGAGPILSDGREVGEFDGKKYVIKKGPYGIYAEISSPEMKKPKRVAIPKNIDLDSVDIAVLQKLEGLPRAIGKHPEDGLVVTASVGPFGPYVAHNKVYASVKSLQDVFEISLEDACQKIEEKKLKPKRTFKRKAKK